MAAVAPTRKIPSVEEDILSGLFDEPRSLPAKYFYDDRGSELFDQICDVPEYYPMRTESALLKEHADAIIAKTRPQRILELGSGKSRKTRYLLDACERQDCHPVYAPFDVCDDVVLESGQSLSETYEWLEVEGLVGDYTGGLGNLPFPEERHLVIFLGGTIGNFSATESTKFLDEVRGMMSDGDTFLIGADRMKDPDVLHSAYNDEQGVTAEFNLNMLNVVNRAVDADFDPGGFHHYAHFNPDESQIEMHLISRTAQQVTLGSLDREIGFDEGDTIRTEISRKFTRKRLDTLLDDAGFSPQVHFEASARPFSLVLADPC
ncbi:MAG: L-histidine N(alpha)-methyltransferase [Pseudomonadota bacterium]